MKNYIPLVLAVLLGLAAVLAVSRVIGTRTKAAEDMSTVVAAQRDIKEGDTLREDMLTQKSVPLTARPADAIVWSKRALLEGQKSKRAVRSGDYILLSDIGLSRGMGSLVGEGEWAVTLNVGNAGIGRIVQPGDEVAVIATFTSEMAVHVADQGVAGQKVTKEVTLVLFPRVRVLESGGSGRGEAGGEVILSLPPQQAQVMIAAQRKAQLTLALRHPGDGAAINRLDTGMVDDGTFQQLLNGVKTINMPAAPGAGEAAK